MKLPAVRAFFTAAATVHAGDVDLLALTAGQWTSPGRADRCPKSIPFAIKKPPAGGANDIVLKPERDGTGDMYSAAEADFAKSAETNTVLINDYRVAKDAGLYGGTCTCPDGQEYTVGDGMSFCTSLACEGGTAGKCRKDTSFGMAMKVTCAGAKKENHYRTVAGAGVWGGLCTCPDGQVYAVGDGQSWCNSLACEGGVSGTCSKSFMWKGAGKKVTCAPKKGSEPTQQAVSVSGTDGLHMKYVSEHPGTLRVRLWDSRAIKARHRFITKVAAGFQSIFIPWTAFEGTLPVPGVLIKCRSYHTCGQLDLSKIAGVSLQWMHSDATNDATASLHISQLSAVKLEGEELVKAKEAQSGYLKAVDVAGIVTKWEEEGSNDFVELVKAVMEESGHVTTTSHKMLATDAPTEDAAVAAAVARAPDVAPAAAAARAPDVAPAAAATSAKDVAPAAAAASAPDVAPAAAAASTKDVAPVAAAASAKGAAPADAAANTKGEAPSARDATPSSTKASIKTAKENEKLQVHLASTACGLSDSSTMYMLIVALFVQAYAMQ